MDRHSSIPLNQVLLANPNPPLYVFQKPNFNLHNEIPSLVKLAHRNKDINISDISDTSKKTEVRLKILKKLKRETQKKRRMQKQLQDVKHKITDLQNKQYKDDPTEPSKHHLVLPTKRTIGRPLTPKTKVRLTLIPNLPTLYSMLVTENIDVSNFKSLNRPPFYKEMKNKFKILKRGFCSEISAHEELLFDEAVDWRFKTTTSSDLVTALDSADGSDISSSANTTSGSYAAVNNATTGGVFPGKSQTVTFLDDDENLDLELEYLKQNPKDSFPSSIGVDMDNIPVYKSIDTAVREIFELKEYTFLRITRSAAFEKTGAIVLKMETAKPGDKWLEDDEFDLNLMFQLFGSEQDMEGPFNSAVEDYGNEITTAFLKKKVARPRYKSNMRIYLIPRDTNVVLYTRESMLRRDIVNGTLDLNDEHDPRMIITAFDFEHVLRDLKII